MIVLLLIACSFAALNPIDYYPQVGKVPTTDTPFLQAFYNMPRGGSGDVISCPSPTDWSFTFDDGPSEFTRELLAKLASHDIRATFFVKGGQALLFPDIIQAAFAAGHQIGIHTWSHPYLTSLNQMEVIREISWTANILYDIIGVVPRYVRPPYGDLNQRTRTLINMMGFTTILWSKDTDDWAGNDVAAQFYKWVNAPMTGTITLQHDVEQMTVSQAPAGMALVKQSGYRTRTVAECLNTDPYLSLPNIASFYNTTFINATFSNYLNASIVGNGTSLNSTAIRNSTRNSAETGSFSHAVLFGLFILRALLSG